MLGAVLLPELRVSKSDTLGVRVQASESVKNRHSLYTSKERDKNRVGVFKEMTNIDKAVLKSKGLIH